MRLLYSAIPSVNGMLVNLLLLFLKKKLNSNKQKQKPTLVRIPRYPKSRGRRLLLCNLFSKCCYDFFVLSPFKVVLSGKIEKLLFLWFPFKRVRRNHPNLHLPPIWTHSFFSGAASSSSCRSSCAAVWQGYFCAIWKGSSAAHLKISGLPSTVFLNVCKRNYNLLQIPAVCDRMFEKSQIKIVTAGHKAREQIMSGERKGGQRGICCRCCCLLRIGYRYKKILTAAHK